MANTALKRSFLIGPITFFALFALVMLVWAVLPPDTVIRWFDANGYAPVELATLPLFAALVPLVWWRSPFGGSRTRRILLNLAVSIVAVMVIIKELDLHLAFLATLWPDYVQNGGLVAGKLFRPNGTEIVGTPFKLRVLTNGAVPLLMKGAILAYFALLFGTFAAGFAYLAWPWLKGVWALEATAWCWGSCCAAGVVAQIADRIPSWLHHAFGLSKQADGGTSALQALCTALEEGGELILGLLAIVTLLLGYRKLREARV